MDIYSSLGVKKIINASDTYTIIGGSRMAPEVLEAMCEASKHFVDINELQDKVYARIAELTGNEAAMVTTGAAAGVALSAAACMTLGRDELVRRIPETDGFARNEFLLFESQGMAGSFGQMIRHAGGKIIATGPSLEEMQSAVSERTAGIFYFPGTLYEAGTPPLEAVIQIASARNVPVVVDAAAQLPPAENFRHYTRTLGADLVLFSGGKYIMGPQSTGLILGKRQYVEACRMNGFPNTALGRPMKVGKEELIGILKAVERFVNSDPEAVAAGYQKLLDKIEHYLKGVPGVKTIKTDRGRLGQTIPLLMVRLPEGRNSLDCHHFLRAGDPAVDIGYFHNGDPGIVFINPINVGDGEVDILIECLLKYFNEVQMQPMAGGAAV